jgi:DNA-3-methyladenine glycosylase II
MSVCGRGKSSLSTTPEEEAYAHIRERFPFLKPLIERVGPVPLPKPGDEPVADVLVRIVAGQMLSQLAARSILARMTAAAERTGCGPLYRLSQGDLRASGLSGRKARTVAFIAALADEAPERLESWRDLQFDELRREVGLIWGLSDWSASVLGIFHFAQPDVFPLGDGSLVRAMRRVEQLYLPQGQRLDHKAASPFGSYLALLLWHALDNNHLTADEPKPTT